MKYKKALLQTVGAAVAFLAFSTPSLAQSEVQYFNGQQYYQEGEHWYFKTETENYQLVDRTVIIKYNDGVAEERIKNLESQFSLTRVRKNILGYYNYLIPVNANIFATANALKESGLISILDFDYYIHSQNPTPAFKAELPGGNGQYHVGFVHAPWVWNDITTGDPNVKVAVLDWGIQWDHPYLGPSVTNYKSNIFCNVSDPWSIPDDPTKGDGSDNDNNGFVDDYKGWDFSPNGTNAKNDVRPEHGYIFHGTMVAGIIAAKKDPGTGYRGIAGGGDDPQGEGVKIIPINIGTSFDPESAGTGGGNTTPDVIANAILYAVDKGARIINLSTSWALNPRTTPVPNDLNDAIKYAYTRGVVLIGCVGNATPAQPLPVEYPATNPYVIAVGGSNYATFDPCPYSCWGKEMSVSAPMTEIISTTPDYTDNLGHHIYLSDLGTSWAAPIVSGVAALMLSANECMASSQIRDILEHTATKGSKTALDLNGHSNQTGYGIVNAYDAVQYAQAAKMTGNLHDLFIKDSPRDFGFPASKDYALANLETSDASPDIWVRNLDDGGTEDQDPEYNPMYQSYVYVRVRNKSCAASYGNETLSLYWTKAAATTPSWPADWDGSKPHAGSLIAKKTIPVILPGQEAIVKFEWTVPSPIFSPSFLARIDKGNDEEITAYPGNLDLEVYNNNNIAMRSVKIVNHHPNRPPINVFNGGSVYIGNSTRIPEVPMNIHFYVPKPFSSTNITSDAEVKLTFDDAGWEFLYGTGQLNQEGIRIVQPKEIVITQPDVTLRNISFPPETQFPVYFQFNFPTETSEEMYYGYRISQSYSETPEQELGGENFHITRYTPDPLDGTARKILADTASNNKSELLQIKAGLINSISPNPASKDVTVAYSLKKVKSATLVMTQMNGTVVGKYNVDLTKTTSTINITNLSTGIYTISLVCDGKVIDAQNFQKQ